MKQRQKVLIIGAGPAGLSLGKCLSDQGVAYEIVEQGTHSGDSWHRMGKNLRLVSPWYQNTLPGLTSTWKELLDQKSAADFCAYLEDYRQRFDIPLTLGVQVSSVAARPLGGFELQTSVGPMQADFIVNCTGYYSQPYRPQILGLETGGITFLHSAEYYDAPALQQTYSRAVRRVLIIGCRISAGQIALELHDAGIDVEIVARRQPLRFSHAPWLAYLSFLPYYFVEQCWTRFSKHPPLGSDEDSYPPMEGGRMKALIRSGTIPLRAGVSRIHQGKVEFADGKTDGYDLILLATGYRPSLNHLKTLVGELDTEGRPALNHFESRKSAGLFFLGMDYQKNFRSRYLRGIREDAVQLASILRERVG